ncbi:hypothetical protein PG994_003078 [Apiospora phragmitis]|uniref:Uncharacterized protein n=1 Tax=Apiospora phragmitis TaxID=2905665 RepID=A0ABR1W711_9PEZI
MQVDGFSGTQLKRQDHDGAGIEIPGIAPQFCHARNPAISCNRSFREFKGQRMTLSAAKDNNLTSPAQEFRRLADKAPKKTPQKATVDIRALFSTANAALSPSQDFK